VFCIISTSQLEAYLFGHRRGKLARHAKIRQLYIPIGGEQYVRGYSQPQLELFPTLDIPMKLPLRVQVFQPSEQLSEKDCDVFLSEDSSFHLLINCLQRLPPTRSEHEPPEQYSMMIHSLDPFK
jgi:hypothetical protein